MRFNWDTSEDIETNEKLNNKFVLKKIYPYFKKEYKAFGQGFMLLLIVTIAELALPLVLKHIIDDSIPNSDKTKLILYSGLYLLIFFASIGFGYLQVIILAKMGLRIVTQIKMDLFNKLLNKDLSFFNSFTPGKLISRVESDAENIKQLFSNIILNMAKNITIFIGIFVILFISDPITTLYVACIVPVTIISTWFMIGFLKQYFSTSRKLYSEIISMVTEFLTAIEVIQVFNYFNSALKKLNQGNLKRYKNDKKMTFYEYGYWGAFMLFEIIAISIVLVIGGMKFASGALTIGTLIMFIEFIRKLFSPIMEFSEYLNMIQKAFVSTNRIFNLMNLKSKIIDPLSPITPTTLTKGIEFRKVSFAYEEGKEVLKDISFFAQMGKTLAIVGASGAGKSTIVNLCLRFYDPQKGEILLDSTNIRDITQDELRKKIGLVTQDLYLFPGTVYDNIKALNPEISDQTAELAAEIVGISELIKKREHGFNTIIKERGANLSVGEKQLLSFARAIALNPEILILDEATSAVDPKTEKLIQEAIGKVLLGRTAIVIAHRLSTIINANQIIVFENGSLKETGSHAELLTGNTIYRRMYDRQSVLSNI